MRHFLFKKVSHYYFADSRSCMNHEYAKNKLKVRALSAKNVWVQYGISRPKPRLIPDGTQLDPICKITMGPMWDTQMGPSILPRWVPAGTHLSWLTGYLVCLHLIII